MSSRNAVGGAAGIGCDFRDLLWRLMRSMVPHHLTCAESLLGWRTDDRMYRGRRV